MTRLHGSLVGLLLPLAILSVGSAAVAAVPADYKGTPYMGTPQSIPGRVELANLDEGGLTSPFTPIIAATMPWPKATRR